jgi:hypothetical protein
MVIPYAYGLFLYALRNTNTRRHGTINHYSDRVVHGA